MEADPLYIEAYCNLGALYFEQGRFEEAAAVLEEGAGLNLVFADVYHNLGNTYQKLGRADEAMAAYRRAVRLNPDFAPSHVNLARSYLLKGDRRRAAEHAGKARALGAAVPEDVLRAPAPY